MKILITGATGFVGSVLLPELARIESATLRVLCLPSEKVPAWLGSMGAEIVRGDVSDKAAVMAAVAGCDKVIHVAGLISYWKLDRDRLFAVNGDGPANVAEACVAHGVKRLVHVSSVGAIGFDGRGGLADEATPFNWPRSFYYMASKKAGEDAIRRAVAEQGLDAVIVNPASIMGPGDPVATSPHNQLYGNMYKSPFFFGTFTGGLAIVDVRDLCSLIVAALEKGRRGEGYLAVGANLRYAEVLKLIGKHAGKKVVAFPVPAPVLVAAGWIMELFSHLTKKRPLLTTAYGRLSGWPGYYSNRKSREELGVEYRGADETVRDGCRYYEATFLGKGAS